MKYNRIKILAVNIVLLLFSCHHTRATNFVLFIADDCSYSDLTCYGSPNSKTPNIDQLAGEGMRFTRCFQAAPMCSPTRHNLYTGIYPTKSGAYPNHTFANEGTNSIVQHLRPLGYRVALAGKRHIAPQEIFDFEYLTQDNDVDFNSVDVFLTDVQKKNDPFCLYICSNEPHTPWNKGNPKNFNPDDVKLPPSWVDTKETREAYCRYLAEIQFMDSQVGKTLELLKKHDLEEETVFIFTSEQGNSFPFAKWTCYNTGLHTAFIVRWPNKVKPGSVSDCLIDYSDVVPTYLDIANAPIPEYIDGTSIKDVWLQKSATAKQYSFGMQTTRGIHRGSDFFGIRSVTDGQYRLVVNFTPDEQFKNVVTEGKAAWWLSWIKKAETDEHAKKQVHNYKFRPAMELYDDLKDPYNQKNLIDNPDLAAVKNRLKNALDDWMVKCGDNGQQTELEALEHQH